MWATVVACVIGTYTNNSLLIIYDNTNVSFPKIAYSVFLRNDVFIKNKTVHG